MAFIITQKRKEYRHEFSDGFALIFRGFEGEERDLFDKELSKIRNASGVLKPYGKSPKQQEAKRQAEERFNKLLKILLKQVAAALLTGWEGAVDEEGAAVALSDEARSAFFSDPESEKYWHGTIVGYLWPSRKADDSQEHLVIDAEVNDVDPKFLTSR